MAVFSDIAKIISGKQQASAARQATAAKVTAANDQLALDKAVYQDQRALTSPQITAGAEAQARQMLMLGYAPEQVKKFLASTSAAVNGGLGNDTLTGGAGGDTLMQRIPGRTWDGQEWAPNMAPVAPAQAPAENFDWVDSYDPQSYLESTPGFRFRTDQARDAVERGASARGRLFSPETMNAVGQRTQDVASDYWGAHFGELGRLAGQGGDAASQQINIAGDFGDNASRRIGEAGDARASGYLRVANAKAQGNQGWADLGSAAVNFFKKNPWGN